MAPSSRHLYPEWLRPGSARGTGPSVTGTGRPAEGATDGASRMLDRLRAFDRHYATWVDLGLAVALFLLCSGWLVEQRAHGRAPGWWPP